MLEIKMADDGSDSAARNGQEAHSERWDEWWGISIREQPELELPLQRQRLHHTSSASAPASSHGDITIDNKIGK